jgi:zinc protease
MKLSVRFVAVVLAIVTACGGAQNTQTIARSATPTASSSPAPGNVRASSSGTIVREAPPAPGPRRDIHFPTIARSNLRNGLEVNVVEYHTLPVVHLRLVARAGGGAADPANLPGLAAFTGDMLKEGTRAHTSAQLADAIEFVGGQLQITTTPDTTTISVSVLRDHLETALGLVNEMVTTPTFPQTEIDKLRRREIDRLTQEEEDPAWLSRRAFYAAVYGTHPYAHFDTTREALRRITRNDIVAFHRARYVAGSMFLAVVGDVRPAEFTSLAEHVLGHIRRGTAPAVTFPAIPNRTAREVIIVDRPESAQSMIRIGNPALRRNSNEWVDLAVANQILGGEASSRLFMDLRERRSLTYGAYSRVTAMVDVGTFQASGAVRTPVTGQALDAFFEHLDRIVREPAPEPEIESSRAYLVDSFPLAIETPGDLAGLLVDLRTYGLPDTYWDTYRTRIAAVTPSEALHAAQQFIHPEQSVVVIVGSAQVFQEHARQYGPVRVIDVNGRLERELPPRS